MLKDSLPERHRKFVEFYVETGCGATAAKEAGYNGKHLRQRAYGLLQNPKIHEAVLELLRKKAAAYAPRAMGMLMELAEKTENDQIRLGALRDLLDRAGFKPVEQHEFTMRDERTDEELEAFLKANLAEAGLKVQH